MPADFIEGFFLGLSTGMVCLAYCGPVLVPYLLGEAGRVRRNIFSVSLFLGGRLLAYLMTGLIAGLAGSRLLQPSEARSYYMAVAFLVLSVMLVFYGFNRFGEVCLGKTRSRKMSRIREKWPDIFPLTGGFLTGINLCPPFLLAITRAVDSGKVGAGILFFFMFFLGTSVYFIPMLFLGILRRQQVLKIIGKFAAIIAGFFYFYAGLRLLIQHF